MKQIHLTEEEINFYYKKAVKELKRHPKRFIDTKFVEKVNSELMEDKKLKKELEKLSKTR